MDGSMVMDIHNPDHLVSRTELRLLSTIHAKSGVAFSTLDGHTSWFQLLYPGLLVPRAELCLFATNHTK